MSNSRTLPPGSTGGTFIAESIKRSMLAVLCALVLPLFLTSCGPTEPSSHISNSNATVTPTTGAPIAGITAPPPPPGSADRPLAPGQSGTQYLPNGLPAFQPPRGINADMLFAEKITDTDERFRRVENAVTDLRREFDAVMPAIVRLTAVEQDMQELLKQLQTLTQGGGVTPADMALDVPIAPVTADSLPPKPFPSAPEEEHPDAASPGPEQDLPATQGLSPDDVPKSSSVLPQVQPAAKSPGNPPEPVASSPPEPLTKAPPPPAITQPTPVAAAAKPPEPAAPAMPAPASGPPAVKAIRTGEQANNVNRLVLDLSGPSTHHSDLDNEEHLLLIEMPEAGWSARPNGDFTTAPLMKSWTTEPMKDGKGTRLVIQLQKSVKIVNEDTLTDPSRIVLDLKESP